MPERVVSALDMERNKKYSFDKSKAEAIFHDVLMIKLLSFVSYLTQFHACNNNFISKLR